MLSAPPSAAVAVMWQTLHASTGTRIVLRSSVFILATSWQAVQLWSGCAPPAWRNVPEDERRRQRCQTVPSATPIDAASFGSKSARAGSAGASLWQALQSLGAGAMPLSCEWQVKQVEWFGTVRNVPFFNQKRSPRSFGGVPVYSCLSLPCGC